MQWIDAQRLDTAMDHARATSAYPQAPVVQALNALTDEAQPDAAFVEALSRRLQVCYTATPASETHARVSARRFNALRAAKNRLLQNRSTGMGRNKLLMRLSWGMTVVCTVLITLAVVLALRPSMLPAKRILAGAAAATARRPGMVEHLVVESYLEITLASAPATREFYIVEAWRKLDAAPGGAAAITARSTIRYAIADVQRQMPVSWAYATVDKTCYLTRDRYGTVAAPPDADAMGCLPGDRGARLFIPELASPNIETDLQLWINRLQGEVETLVYEQTTFFGKPAFSFTEKQGAATFTLYVDPNTTYPLGFVARTPAYTLTQIIHIYEIVAAESLTEDPFVWPPVALGEKLGQVQPSLRDNSLRPVGTPDRRQAL